MLTTLVLDVTFYWQRKSEDSAKTTDISQVTDKYFHIKSCRIHLATSGNIIHNFSVDMYCRTAILSLFLYMILCLSVMLDSLSCSVISISFSY
jgi:hypothetical protein